MTLRQDLPREVAALPHRGPYIAIGPTLADLAARLGRAGVAPAGPAVAIYYDMPGVMPDEELRTHAGMEVAPGAAVPAGALTALPCPAGGWRCSFTAVPARGLRGSGTRHNRWLGASRRKRADRPPYELYLNDPGDAQPEDLLTEICIPLREGG
jgi:AraC family transcriptional regulator